MRNMIRTIGFFCAMVVMVGCQADTPLNPSFPVTVRQAEATLRKMKEQPKLLQRPVVVLSGYKDPGIIAPKLAKAIRKHTGDDRVVTVTYGFNNSFDECCAKVIEELTEAFPGSDAEQTIEVDVVAISMGGLVARYAAMPQEIDIRRIAEGRHAMPRLNINRLFTISTPHRGANMAKLPTLNGLQIAMRTGSDFLTSLDDVYEDMEYELYCYVRLDDLVVGAENAAPPGRTAWWVANQPFEPAHISAHDDPRILADILRRLRGEAPLATQPAAPLPVDD